MKVSSRQVAKESPGVVKAPIRAASKRRRSGRREAAASEKPGGPASCRARTLSRFPRPEVVWRAVLVAVARADLVVVLFRGKIHSTPGDVKRPPCVGPTHGLLASDGAAGEQRPKKAGR